MNKDDPVAWMYHWPEDPGKTAWFSRTPRVEGVNGWNPDSPPTETPLYATPPSPQPDMGNVIANDALNLLDLIGKHIQDAEIWRKVHKDATELRDRLAALSSPASQSVEQMREALEPFATFAKTFVDDEGWIGPMNKERIVDWFGPSDFRRTAAALPHKEEATPAPVGEQGETEGEKRSFNLGYLIAVSNLVNMHDDTVAAEDLLRALGCSKAEMERFDLTDYDRKPLRRLFREMARKDAHRRATPATTTERGRG